MVSGVGGVELGEGSGSGRVRAAFVGGGVQGGSVPLIVLYLLWAG